MVIINNTQKISETITNLLTLLNVNEYCDIYLLLAIGNIANSNDGGWYTLMKLEKLASTDKGLSLIHDQLRRFTINF